MLHVIALLIHSQSVNWTFGLGLEEGELDRGTALEENLSSIESQLSLTAPFYQQDEIAVAFEQPQLHLAPLD